MISHGARKRKGSIAERDLIHKFWEADWAAARVAGSGSAQYPQPDILAGNNIRKVVIEAKVTADKAKYFLKQEIEDLKEFAVLFGAEPWVAIKFNKHDWLFINPEDLKETDKGYSINTETAERRGLGFDELLRD